MLTFLYCSGAGVGPVGRPCGSALWVGPVGRPCGSALWVGPVGRPCGSALWVGPVGRPCGSALWVGPVGRPCGSALWVGPVGRPCGSALWVGPVGRPCGSALWPHNMKELKGRGLSVWTLLSLSWIIGDSRFPVGVNVSVSGCLLLRDCLPVVPCAGDLRRGNPPPPPASRPTSPATQVVVEFLVIWCMELNWYFRSQLISPDIYILCNSQLNTIIPAESYMKMWSSSWWLLRFWYKLITLYKFDEEK